MVSPLLPGLLAGGLESKRAGARLCASRPRWSGCQMWC
ncbi:hypothetical protein thalar_01187 [Litoreibacter arenae DSM 19593]|uniref:Uncharacterized protein n=1 Tax=Litoreibacter arenae DSM 19593 TaxID=1123360 RepID=S9QEI8_9RHOB|nr:hypothetical protein thalar_01187 [Litoreibacter arenae DSM 19593]